MPRGIANLMSMLPSAELIKRLEALLNTKEIRLELPETNKVQVWTTEGEMLQIEKEELFSKSMDISNYLIQFWWPQMDDISMKLAHEDQLCVCNIYLDGLNECQCRDILDLLISITLHNIETVGFVIDRTELSSEFEWIKIFSDKKYLDNHRLEDCGLKVCKKYELNDGNKEQIKDFEVNYVYIAIPNREKGTIDLYLLQ